MRRLAHCSQHSPSLLSLFLLLPLPGRGTRSLLASNEIKPFLCHFQFPLFSFAIAVAPPPIPDHFLFSHFLLLFFACLLSTRLRKRFHLQTLIPSSNYHYSTMSASSSFARMCSFGGPSLNRQQQKRIFNPTNFSLDRSCLQAPHADPKMDAMLDSLKWDDKGLVVAIAQNLDTGAILMQGFANRDALVTTISSRKATFYSRSRSTLWTKGETSMNFLHVHDIFLDCDRDSVIYLGKPDGPTCHTGSETCYYTSISDALKEPQIVPRLASTTLYSLENTIFQRKEETENSESGKPSWTKRLMLNSDLLCSKIREEAEELVQTLLEGEDRNRTASEMADLLYHAMVLLSVRDVKMEEVFEVLRNRFSQSGIEEKNARKKPMNLS